MENRVSLKEAISNAIKFYENHAEEHLKLSKEVENDKDKYQSHIIASNFYYGKAKGFEEALGYINELIG